MCFIGQAFFDQFCNLATFRYQLGLYLETTESPCAPDE